MIREAAEKLEAATLDPSHTIALHAGLLRSILNDSRPKPSGPPTFRTDEALHALQQVAGDGLQGSTDPEGAGPSSEQEQDRPSPFLSPASPPPPSRDADSSAHVFVPVATGASDGWDDGWLEETMRVSVDTGMLDFALFDFRPPN